MVALNHTTKGVRKQVDALRIVASTEGYSAIEERCDVAIEAPLTIDVSGRDSYIIMCTPSDTRALVVGFLYTEGIIDDLAKISSLTESSDDPSVVHVQLSGAPQAAASGRTMLMTSACRLDGDRDLEGVLESLPKVGDTFTVAKKAIHRASRALAERQQLYPRTRGTHAAGIFTEECVLVAFAEDVGRHNALDKVIGQCLLEGMSPKGHGIVLSGRVSLEMVSKSARAGLEMIVAVSAPTSLAVEAAEQANITLCGSVKGNKATVFTHPGRLS